MWSLTKLYIIINQRNQGIQVYPGHGGSEIGLVWVSGCRSTWAERCEWLRLMAFHAAERGLNRTDCLERPQHSTVLAGCTFNWIVSTYCIEVGPCQGFWVVCKGVWISPWVDPNLWELVVIAAWSWFSHYWYIVSTSSTGGGLLFSSRCTSIEN